MEHFDWVSDPEPPGPHDPGVPSPTIEHRLQELGAPRRTDVGQQIEVLAGGAGLGDHATRLSDSDRTAGEKLVEGGPRGSNVLATIAGRDRPAFATELLRGLQRLEEDRHVGIVVLLLVTVPAEVPFEAGRGEKRLGDCRLWKTPFLPDLGLPMQSMDRATQATGHGGKLEGENRSLRLPYIHAFRRERLERSRCVPSGE